MHKLNRFIKQVEFMQPAWSCFSELTKVNSPIQPAYLRKKKLIGQCRRQSVYYSNSIISIVHTPITTVSLTNVGISSK